MIIDLILDREGWEQDGYPGTYNAKQFYDDCMEYGGSGWYIARAMDFGTEEQVKEQLCKYIDGNHYNPEIKDYINSVNWIGEEE